MSRQPETGVSLAGVFPVMRLADSNWCKRSLAGGVADGDAAVHGQGVTGGTPTANDRDLPESNWCKRSTADLETEWRKCLDYADENDDEGGHVGWSRYYREQSYAIEAELRRRRLADPNWCKRP